MNGDNNFASWQVPSSSDTSSLKNRATETDERAITFALSLEMKAKALFYGAIYQTSCLFVESVLPNNQPIFAVAV